MRILIVALLYTLASSACGLDINTPPHTDGGNPAIDAAESYCGPGTTDGLIPADLHINILRGTIDRTNCIGGYRCTSKDYCRIEFIYSSDHDVAVSGEVQTLNGTVNLSNREELLGALVNSRPVENLTMCGYTIKKSKVYLMYVAMSNGAEITSTSFHYPYLRCLDDLSLSTKRAYPLSSQT